MFAQIPGKKIDLQHNAQIVYFAWLTSSLNFILCVVKYQVLPKVVFIKVFLSFFNQQFHERVNFLAVLNQKLTEQIFCI